MTMRFKELPKREHDTLVRDYWKTWLSAWNFRVRNKAALDAFVAAMEARVMDLYLSGGMEMDGVTTQDDDE
jgi:hypothetical protein